MNYPDLLASVVHNVGDQLHGVWVADRLPLPLRVEDLPAVWVNPVPGSSGGMPWNGHAPLWDEPSFDVDILMPKSGGVGALRAMADRVREAIFRVRIADPAVSLVTEEVPFAPRPDWNDQVIRYGGEYSMRTRRIV